MAPEANTLSPQEAALAPRDSTQSQSMGPPAAPASTGSLAQRSVIGASDEVTGAPIRHPRPLTAAEMYLECEKEQEAVVNRLTRELTALRAQTASVASNASGSSISTSASLLPVDISDLNPAHQLTGPTHPIPSRDRSNSSVSTRSIPTPSTSSVLSSNNNNNNINAHAVASSTAASAGSVSQASIDRAAAISSNLSRQPSISASGSSTPARRSIDFSRYAQQTHIRPSLSRDASYASQGASSVTAQAGTPAVTQRAASPSLGPTPPNVQAAMQHLSEATTYRTEMEIVKAENEALRQRVRALERALRSRRRDSNQSDPTQHDSNTARSDAGHYRTSRDAISPMATSLSSSGAGIAAWAAGSGVGGVAGPRERSESQSTTASSRRGLPPDEEVRVGESAASLAHPRAP